MTDWGWKDKEWWEYPVQGLELLGEGMEQTFNTLGAVITSPVRPWTQDYGWTGANPLRYLPGGSEYNEYVRWKEAKEDPYIPAGIPSWRQMQAWGIPGASLFAEEGEKPEGYEMARMGMAETAEIAPLFFTGGGGTKTSIEKLTESTSKQILKGKTTEESLQAAYKKAAGKGYLPSYKMGAEPVSEAVIEKPTQEIYKPVQDLAVKYVAIPERTFTADIKQLSQAHKLAKAKGLLTKKGVPTKSYRNLAEIYTGKTSMKEMSRSEADAFITAIDGLETNAAGKAVIPKMRSLVDKEFWDAIPFTKDVGIVDYFRQKPKVLQMINMKGFSDDLLKAEVESLEEKQVFLKELTAVRTKLGNNSLRKERIFKAIENPLESHLLDPDEQQAFLYFKRFFDDWAKTLKLGPEKTRKNYVTHIFDEQVKQDIKQGRTIPLEIMKAMEFSYPRKSYMPFLKERTGKEVGLKLDPFEAAEVYESYALREKYYTPFLQKLSAYINMFEARGKTTTANYLKDMTRRIAGRPSQEDILINTEVSKSIKNLMKIPGIKDSSLKLEDLVNRGNLGALVAHNMSSIYYISWLGFRPASAIRNLSQQLLAAATTGVRSFANGLSLRSMQEGKSALAESLVYRGRLLSNPVAGLEESALQKVPQKLQDTGLSMFKWADKQNVADSFLAGYAQGKSLGLPREWAIKLGDEVAANTQYLYTKMSRSLFEDSTAGRFLSPFTSWTRNFMELMASWVQGKQSLVLQDYMKQTGKTLNIPKTDRTALYTYLALLTGAYTVEGTTPLKATEYTGWTSVKNLGKLLGGDIPALQIIKGLAYLSAGAATGDETMIKEGWYEVRPDKFVQIVSQLESIAEGKQDILSLFFYLDREEMNQESNKDFKRIDKGFRRTNESKGFKRVD